MNSLFLAVSILVLRYDSCSAFSKRLGYVNESTLELVHVLFRHGDRTPDENTLYPNNPYFDESNYYPYGYGQLTNEGKMRIYNLGTTIRKRYKNFLGKVWNSNVLGVRCSDYERTKMSAELFTAGMWPPTCENIWNSVFHWQPIPYTYEKRILDKELVAYDACAKNFDTLLVEIWENSTVNDYIIKRYNETFNILANRTESEITMLKVFLLYFGFSMQEELNLPLEDWVSSVYPEPLHSFVLDYYHFEFSTTGLKKIIPGYLLKKILTDTQNKADGTLKPRSRKMFIYAGHEINIAGLLIALKAYDLVEFPPYGSYLLLELHKVNGAYGIMLFYQDNKDDHPKGPLKILGCEEFCPLDQFVALIDDILPTSDQECFGIS